MLSPSLALGLSAPPEECTGSAAAAAGPALGEFAAWWRGQCIEGSAISPSLYAAAVEVWEDFQPDALGNVQAPISEALGWNQTRFGQQVRQALIGAIFRNEDGSAWQVRLASPRRKENKPGEFIKYETPSGRSPRTPITTAMTRENFQRHHHQADLLIRQLQTAAQQRWGDEYLSHWSRALGPEDRRKTIQQILRRGSCTLPLLLELAAPLGLSVKIM